MYCIVHRKFGNKRYLAYQNTESEIVCGYHFTDRDTYIMNLSSNNKKHPTLFKTKDAAYRFIDEFISKRKGFNKNELSCEWVDSKFIPNCDMDCWKCNKKYKSTCRKLRNPYQNICGFIMAKFEDGFRPDENRFDAPCEKCLTRGCLYNMNF